MTNQKRVATYRAKLKKEGITSVSVQCHKDDMPKIKKFSKDLLEKRKQKADKKV